MATTRQSQMDSNPFAFLLGNASQSTTRFIDPELDTSHSDTLSFPSAMSQMWIIHSWLSRGGAHAGRDCFCEYSRPFTLYHHHGHPNRPATPDWIGILCHALQISSIEFGLKSTIDSSLQVSCQNFLTTFFPDPAHQKPQLPNKSTLLP